MAASTHILVVILLLAASPTLNAQERCSYMTAIPREERPDDLPDIEWEGGWGNRPLIPAEDREDLCMDGYFPGSATSGTQVIYMEESIEGDIAIAKLNYQGTATPEIAVPFLAGSFNNLGPAIRRVDDEWLLYITQRQDFESPGMQNYMFNVRIQGQALVAAVSLQIVNIDDNDPMIQAVDRCVVPELGEARLTECVYVVTDADGEISTRFMRFELVSDRVDDHDIFYIEGGGISADWRSMTMTVGINQALDFEINPLHIFQVTAIDSWPNTHTVTLMVQVENVEHRPPRWLEIFAVQRILEKTPRNFTMRAIDGDTGINKAIDYRIVADDPFFRIETIEGGYDGAILYVDPIDRDYLEREIFTLTVIAFKFDNESFYTEAPIVIIVDDVNDQTPEPIRDEYHVSIEEETPLTLNFDYEFGFHDRDLGEHAQYSVRLESVSPPGAQYAFYIAPEVGYQRQTFIMGTNANHSMLDYEVPEFQHIHLRVIATDMNNTLFVGVTNVYIDLVNWNDELPIFELATQNVSFNETEGAGFFVANVRAHDRDIDDWVQHSLMGNAMDFLTIDEDTGDIYVLLDDAFDYHRQNQLFVQVRADDTLMAPYHTTTSQLLIQLEDVNNTPPTLRLPRGSPQVEENVPEGFEVTSDLLLIRATDPDTTASLRFEIDWETSYATKVGETDPTEFHGCVYIETYQDPEVTGSAVGRLYAREIREDVTIDFEMFEMLYLTIRVRDVNTVIGEDYDEATMAITIIDMNDNPPVWSDSSLEAEFRVREMSASDTAVGSVLATDIDGPLYNQVRYTINPRENTPDGLVKIDFDTGQISVDANAAIDADLPPRWDLYYTVTASDCCYAELCPPDPHCHYTDLEMAISIIDINNKVPEPEFQRFNTTVEIYEDALSGHPVLQMYAMDLDRDEIYHEVSYQINYAVNPRIRDFFEVDRETGLIYVHYTDDAVHLDRDRGEPTHTIFVQLIDNFLSQGDGNRNQNPDDIEVLVVLLDVNDNAPQLPLPDTLPWSVSEGAAAGVRILPEIYAPDIDEPDTPNSHVGYAILSLTVRDRDIEVPDLFNMINIENKTGELETAMELRSYWGTYDILIEAYDHGVPQMNDTETYQLVIHPYNFHSPQFVFPTHETTIRLSGEWAIAGLILRTVDNENLDSVAATDEDGLDAGVVTFAVTGNDEAVQYFEILNQGNNAGMLQLRQDVTEQIREFQVTITATDGGTDPRPLSSETTVRVAFVPTTGDPVFSTDTICDVAFFELEAGLSETSELPLAFDPKNHLCVENCHSIYYRIIDGNDAGHFVLDATTNVLSLARELVREEADTLTLTVAASNSPAETTQPGSTVTCTVTVREADPRPRFERELYTAGISTGDLINRELLTVHATHSEGVPITYNIDMDSIEADPSLEVVKLIAFVLHPQSGLLVLNIQPTAAMQGMFEFNVVATDPANEMDTTEVKVYLISALNRIFFLFLNTVEQIEANRDFIAQTLSNGFGMTCNIDQIVPASDQNGVASETNTEIRAHFILNDIPVNADVIEELRSDTDILINIRNVLFANAILLHDFVTDVSPDVAVDANQITVYVLAGLAVILGLMVIVLLVTLVIRTRRLNRQMAALSTKKFGSIDSGLNRTALAAPGTNQFAMGTNPVWNEDIRAPNFDALSDSSGDSDLVGIEDLPQFMNDYFPDENNLPNGMQQPSTSRDTMPTPFNPGFAKNQSSSRY